MSEFAVTIEEIKEILPHGNADRLELGTLMRMSFRFVVQKGAFKAGDKVVYFPLDSLIPEDLQDVLGVKNHLAGSEKNRVKTVKLRGMISQGIVAPLQEIQDFLNGPTKCNDSLDLFESSFGIGWDLSEALAVEKYEPPEVEDPSCTLRGLQGGFSMYDIEGADRHPEVVEILMDQRVHVTEKLEGKNSWFHLTVKGEFTFGQRRYHILPKEGCIHPLQAWAERADLKGAMKNLFRESKGQYSLTLYGEAVGPGAIPKNYYGLKEMEIRFFDIKVDGCFLHHEDDLYDSLGKLVPTVPDLACGPTLREWLRGETIQEASSGNSHINPDKRREGIVIIPYKEQVHPAIGRLFIKQRSPVYLAKTDF